MQNYKKAIWQIIVISIWVNISETLRWVLFSKPYLADLYKSMNITLPNEPINNILWLIWGTIIAVMIFIIAQKYTLVKTTFIIWIIVFVTHWIALWNFAVLPTSILWVVIPLSFLEIFIGALISKYFLNKSKN